MIKKIAIAVVGLVLLSILAVMGLALTQPDEFKVSRSIVVQAQAERAFAQVNDFQKWGAWSPWDKIDPGMKRTHSGAASGLGAVYEWQGNKEVGRGSMEIVESLPPNKVAIDLHFLEPFEAQNLTVFTFSPQGETTEVEWTMTGKNAFVSKIMCVFMDLDAMIGADFEKGLVQLKRVVESSSK